MHSCIILYTSSYPDVELYIVETQTGNQIKTENQMTLVCNASNFNAAIDTITFFGPNELKQVCPNPPATEKNFPDGTITRSGQTCSLKILKPSLAYGGVYYCQFQPLSSTCFHYTSNQVEILLMQKIMYTGTNNTDDHMHIDYFHAFEGALIAAILVSCALVLLVVVLLVILIHCRLYKRRAKNQGTKFSQFC